MSEMRLAKFEILVEDINNMIKNYTLSYIFSHKITKKDDLNIALALIFDYDSCNEYAKKIFECSELIDHLPYRKLDLWKEKYSSIASFDNKKTKIEAAKQFVQCCREIEYKSEGIKFIFWALMILTVDKQNAEESLSLICDFAKMLEITDEEFKDLVHVIKCVYHEEEKEHEVTCETVLGIFYEVIDKYGNSN